MAKRTVSKATRTATRKKISIVNIFPAKSADGSKSVQVSLEDLNTLRDYALAIEAFTNLMSLMDGQREEEFFLLNPIVKGLARLSNRLSENGGAR